MRDGEFLAIGRLRNRVLSENCAHPFSPTVLRGRPVVKVEHAAHALPSANDTLAVRSRQRLNELIPDALMSSAPRDSAP